VGLASLLVRPVAQPAKEQLTASVETNVTAREMALVKKWLDFECIVAFYRCAL
jgi:hypothetical protein